MNHKERVTGNVVSGFLQRLLEQKIHDQHIAKEDKKNKPTIPISSKVYTLFQVNQTVGAFVEF